MGRPPLRFLFYFDDNIDLVLPYIMFTLNKTFVTIPFIFWILSPATFKKKRKKKKSTKRSVSCKSSNKWIDWEKRNKTEYKQLAKDYSGNIFHTNSMCEYVFRKNYGRIELDGNAIYVSGKNKKYKTLRILWFFLLFFTAYYDVYGA